MDQDTKRRLDLTLQENIEAIENLFEFPQNYSREKLNIAILEDDKETLAKLKEEMAACKIKRDKIIASLEACKTAEERDKVMCSVNLKLD